MYVTVLFDLRVTRICYGKSVWHLSPRHLENEPPVRRINISFLHQKKDRSHVDVQTKILTGANPHKQFKFTVNVPQFRRKNSNKSKKFFSWNCIFGRFKLFPSSNIDFWPILKLQKMAFGPKCFSWNWFIWFHEFFWPGLF